MVDNEHPGAVAVILIFKFAAILSLIGAVVIAVNNSLPSSARIGLAFGGVLGAATLAFFAYVLEYLAEIRDNTDQIPELDADS